ncbi:hypothetical protein [Mucilaginibacter sp.]|uniref:hypothetical protein n=1 Tax=Mucilaginibacter sp. TaxID=1882438 RepID=UPI003265F280
MGLFYNVSAKELLEARNELFVKKGIPALQQNGFERSPFAVDWFGRNNLKDFTYVLCRLAPHSQLQVVNTHISRGDKWIKIFLNIFELTPAVKSLDQLKDTDGLQYHLPPNSRSEMRLRSDDFEGMPLFNFVHHKVKPFYTEGGFRKRMFELGALIEEDLNNIDRFAKRWHELHKPLITDWEGRGVKEK